MSKTSTTTKTKPASKKAPVAPRAAKPTPPAKTIYRLCVADEGRQMIGECGSADEAAKKAKAFQKKQAVPVEIARGKVVGSKFVADFTEVLQPANSAEPVTATTIANEATTPVEATTAEPAAADAATPATKAPRAKPAKPATQGKRTQSSR